MTRLEGAYTGHADQASWGDWYYQNTDARQCADEVREEVSKLLRQFLADPRDSTFGAATIAGAAMAFADLRWDTVGMMEVTPKLERSFIEAVGTAFAIIRGERASSVPEIN